MKIKHILTVLTFVIILAGAAGWYFYYLPNSQSSQNQYETVTVTRGPIERVIVSSGTLDPVGSVEVGTQVSGTVDKVLVDFNDTVKAGQIIAEIDRSVLISKLSEAQATLSRAEALFLQSEQEYKRGETLFEKGLISEQEAVKSRTDYHTQKASLQVAKAAVTTAAENVRYATIRSPVKGTVITRNVEVGQTVAASLSAPTLFVIAEDLRQMKIMALVDETDIGKIRADQEVRFSVQAYPEKIYTGSVSQIRLQPEIIQNVVTYTVVILARNNDGTLLPGMTANVEFVEAREDSALVVPASALRFRPPEEIEKKFEEERQAEMEARAGGGGGLMKRIDEAGGIDVFLAQNAGDERLMKRIEEAGGVEEFKRKMADGKAARMQPGVGPPPQMKQVKGDGKEKKKRRGGDPSRGILWTLDENNELRPIYVRAGLSDGVITAVSGRDDLYEGLKVVTGEAKKDKGKKKNGKSNRSLLPQGGPPGPRRL